MPASERSTASTARRQEQAHRRSVTVSSEDILASLIEKLGPRLTAFMVGKDTTTISRWSNNKVPANEETLRPLLVAFQVVDLLETVEDTPTVRAWFIGMNPQLDDDSPTEAIAAGKHREVMAAARAFVAGG